MLLSYRQRCSPSKDLGRRFTLPQAVMGKAFGLLRLAVAGLRNYLIVIVGEDLT